MYMWAIEFMCAVAGGDGITMVMLTDRVIEMRPPTYLSDGRVSRARRGAGISADMRAPLTPPAAAAGARRGRRPRPARARAPARLGSEDRAGCKRTKVQNPHSVLLARLPRCL